MRDLIFTSVFALVLVVAGLESAIATSIGGRNVVRAHTDLAGNTHYRGTDGTYHGANRIGFDRMARYEGVKSQARGMTPGFSSTTPRY